MGDYYSRTLRLNLSKKSHKRVHDILINSDSSGNQLIIDAILHYCSESCKEKVSVQSSALINTEALNVVEPDFNFIDT